MPAFLNIEDLQRIQFFNPDYQGIDTFVESGTGRGQTTFHLSPFFKRIYTVELATEYYKWCMQKAEELGITNVDFYNGNSLNVLPRILEILPGRAIFWLDGHYCKNDTGRGEIDPPMREELQLILANHTEPSIVLIDNVEVFGKKGPLGDEDWSHISVEYIMHEIDPSRIHKQYIDNDMMVILLNKLEK
jgi:hypothetical protein